MDETLKRDSPLNITPDQERELFRRGGPRLHEETKAEKSRRRREHTQALMLLSNKLGSRYHAILSQIYDLSDYEIKILCMLLSTNQPVSVYTLQHSAIPRTKVYGTCNKLVKAGLIKPVVISEAEVTKPGVWEFWDAKKQKSWLHSKGVGLWHYLPEREKIRARVRDIFNNAWSMNTDYQDLEKEVKAMQMPDPFYENIEKTEAK